MDRRLSVARSVAAAATTALIPTAAFAAGSRMFTALAVFEAALLAVATAYAVYLGLYRYPR
jgi:hypothetical protein